MDPISLIIAAVTAGAAAAVKDTASSAIKDTYGALKGLIARRFAGDRDAEKQLDRVEQQPDADTEPLAERLRAAAADQDDELLRAARALLAEVDPEGTRSGKYTVHVSGGKGVVVGDHNPVTMHFGDGE